MLYLFFVTIKNSLFSDKIFWSIYVETEFCMVIVFYKFWSIYALNFTHFFIE